MINNMFNNMFLNLFWFLCNNMGVSPSAFVWLILELFLIICFLGIIIAGVILYSSSVNLMGYGYDIVYFISDVNFNLVALYTEIAKWIGIYNYIGNLDTLTPDNIVCLFNIILDCFIFSSFISLLAIFLGDYFLNNLYNDENYASLFILISLSDLLNNNVTSLLFCAHLILILCGVLVNISMYMIG